MRSSSPTSSTTRASSTGAGSRAAETFVYRHGDPEHLAWGLGRAEGRGSLIVTDGVFSMDGDVAPIADLVELARRYDCRLMVDEAHATGAIGPDGEGAVAEAGLVDEVDVIAGTLGKALGSYGAYVCASREITELLVNAARPFIFSTALPPPSVAAAIASLKLIGARPERIDRLRRNGDMMRRELAAYGLDPGESRTQIIPLIVGDADAALELCERALERGVFAQAIRPPTVPDGTSRLRISVMASHRASELRHAAKIVGTAARDLGLCREADEWDWEEPVPVVPPEVEPIPSKAPPRPPSVGAPSLASQMPPGPLSIDLDEAA